MPSFEYRPPEYEGYVRPLDDVVQYDSEECCDAKFSCLIREANTNTVMIRIWEFISSVFFSYS
jgi:hypothetical protein